MRVGEKTFFLLLLKSCKKLYFCRVLSNEFFQMKRWTVVCVIFCFSALLFSSCRVMLRNGDLVFFQPAGSDLEKAISLSTRTDTTLNFCHVGIVEILDGFPYVIEAVPEGGVERTLMGSHSHETYFIYRVRHRYAARNAVVLAWEHLGEPYDFYFQHDNGRMYCSELVWECCRKRDGSHLFSAQPMNFKSPDGTMPAYWVEWFTPLGVPIPQGEPGTNPNGLAQSKHLRFLGTRRYETCID